MFNLIVKSMRYFKLHQYQNNDKNRYHTSNGEKSIPPILYLAAFINTFLSKIVEPGAPFFEFTMILWTIMQILI
jgi:hypothetical protein